MKILAIKGRIGNTIYYVANLNFETLSRFVNRLNVEEIYTSGTLKDVLQRSLTDNVSKIKDYILTHDDRFFNSLVLAVYDGNPKWEEVNFEVNDVNYGNVGLLEFSGEEKIFPIDGQHRLEGIKESLKENIQLGSETIPVILIGHQHTNEGNKKTRRIFSILNRYARPVRKGDIVALDEDDIIAICTRNLLETHNLFMGNHVKISNSKSIPVTDKTSFTTLMTLYDCIEELYKAFYFSHNMTRISEQELKEYKKKRPSDKYIDDFTDYISLFWTSLCSVFSEVNDFSTDNSNISANLYRPGNEGGHLFFRPVGLLPFISAICEIKIKDVEASWNDILSFFRDRNITNVSSDIWSKILWNPLTNRMVMHNNNLVKYLLINLYDNTYLTAGDKDKMIDRYATVLNIENLQVAEERITNHFNSRSC